jgi:hypothetical protein
MEAFQWEHAGSSEPNFYYLQWIIFSIFIQNCQQVVHEAELLFIRLLPDFSTFASPVQRQDDVNCRPATGQGTKMVTYMNGFKASGA